MILIKKVNVVFNCLIICIFFLYNLLITASFAENFEYERYSKVIITDKTVNITKGTAPVLRLSQQENFSELDLQDLITNASEQLTLINGIEVTENEKSAFIDSEIDKMLAEMLYETDFKSKKIDTVLQEQVLENKDTKNTTVNQFTLPGEILDQITIPNKHNSEDLADKFPGLQMDMRAFTDDDIQNKLLINAEINFITAINPLSYQSFILDIHEKSKSEIFLVLQMDTNFTEINNNFFEADDIGEIFAEKENSKKFADTKEDNILEKIEIRKASTKETLKSAEGNWTYNLNDLEIALYDLINNDYHAATKDERTSVDLTENL